MLKDIISILLRERTDFGLLMDIYMNTKDDITSDTLRKHFILEKSKPKEMYDINGINNEASNPYIKFGISLSCLNNDDKYYHKFMKGMLKYMQLCFKKEYLYDFLQEKYFDNFDKSSLYTQNIESIESSLRNMLKNMRRYIFEELNSKVALQEENTNKIPLIKYRILCVKIHLHENKSVLDIYDNCQNNDQIIHEIDNLEKNNKSISLDFLALKNSINEYLEKEKYKQQLEKTISIRDTELCLTTKEIEDLRTNINTLKKKDKKKNSGNK